MRYINTDDGSSKIQGVLKRPPQKEKQSQYIYIGEVSRYPNILTGSTTSYECHKQNWHCEL